MNIFKRTFHFLKNVTTAASLAVGQDSLQSTATVDVNGDMRVRLLGDGSNIDSVAVVDADGNVYKRDLAGLYPSDTFLNAANYDENTNTLNLTLSDGSNIPVDLSDLVDLGNITTLVDSNGDTSVEVERLADEDIVWVTVETNDVMEVKAESLTMIKNMEMKSGYAVNTVVVEDDYYAPLDTDQVMIFNHSNPTNSYGEIQVALESIDWMKDGKVFEFKNESNVDLRISVEEGHLLDNGEYFMVLSPSKGERYVKLILDQTTHEFIVVEEMERDGIIYDGVPASGATTITDPVFSGLSSSNVNLYRDGVMESSADFTLSNGVLTVTGAFEGEDVQVRRV